MGGRDLFRYRIMASYILTGNRDFKTVCFLHLDLQSTERYLQQTSDDIAKLESHI